MNKATFIGNLTADPEVETTEKGTVRATFTIAVSERYRDKDGEWQDGHTEYVPVVAWGMLAQHVGQSFAKGDRVFAAGRISLRKVKGDDETSRTFTDLVAEDAGLSVLFKGAGVYEEAGV